MIGIIASILTAVLTGNYLPLIVPLIYLLAVKSRDLALIAFYIYALVLAFSFNPGSIYTLNGISAVSVAFSAVLVLDEILRGFELRIPSREEFVLLGALTVSAVTIYTFLPVIAAVTLYTAHRNFGRASFYIAGWWILLAAFLYAAKNRLTGRGAQPLVIVGLALIFILLAEKRGVKSTEVKVLGRIKR